MLFINIGVGVGVLEGDDNPVRGDKGVGREGCLGVD